VADVMQRLLAAMNAHDLDAFVECFAPDYRSEQPAHPARAFTGNAQVRANWASVFAGVADLSARLLVAAQTDDGTEIGEWCWSGTYADGSPFAMAGVIVAGVAHGRITWARLYMERVDDDGVGIDEVVRDTYRPPAPD
jgi:ketosteroid isomerase-like protein